MRFVVFIFVLLFWNLSSPIANACSGAINLDYMLRENRYEGITSNNISGSLSLISLATKGISTLADSITIQVPKTDNISTPEITINAQDNRYRMDRFTPVLEQSFYSFSWPTCVLQQARISISNLHALARTSNSPVIYLPVIIGQPASEYEIVFFAERPTRFNSLEIRRDNQVLYRESRSSFEGGGEGSNEIKFVWNGRNAQDNSEAARGRYKIHYEAEIEQSNSSPELISSDPIQFEHDPAWLR